MAIAWSGCGWGDGAIIGRCPEGATRECCPCSIDEDCPDGAPPIPEYCDGGLDTRLDGGTSLLCPGACVPRAPETWTGPDFFYEGPRVFEPECPEPAPLTTFEGVTGPEALPLTCGACACDPPEGTCSVPAVWTLGSGPCSELGGLVKTNFDPPTNWDGTCSADDAIPAGKMCSGQPCVQSITVSEPVIEEKCTSRTLDPWPDIPKFYEDSPMSDETTGKSCGLPTDTVWPACAENPIKACLPNPGPDFSICIHKEGDEACPDSWPVRILYYDEVDDQRTCAPCGCDKPTDAMCSYRLTLGSDSACSVVTFENVIGTGMPNGVGCADLGIGIALGSKAAEIVEFSKGSCTPTGGVPIGDLILDKPTTFCCLPK